MLHQIVLGKKNSKKFYEYKLNVENYLNLKLFSKLNNHYNINLLHI